MATLLERNKTLRKKKKTSQDHAEDALYREVWEEINNEKTQMFLKRYAKQFIITAIVILAAVTIWQITSQSNRAHKIGIAHNYEQALQNMDVNALAALSDKNKNATADLALFQAWALSGDIKHLEKLSQNASTRDFKDLALIHLASSEKGQKMTAKEFETFLKPLTTKKSPFYYNSMLLIAQKYIAEDKKEDAKVWVNKITNDKDAPVEIYGAAEMLK